MMSVVYFIIPSYFLFRVFKGARGVDETVDEDLVGIMSVVGRKIFIAKIRGIWYHFLSEIARRQINIVLVMDVCPCLLPEIKWPFDAAEMFRLRV